VLNQDQSNPITSDGHQNFGYTNSSVPENNNDYIFNQLHVKPKQNYQIYNNDNNNNQNMLNQPNNNLIQFSEQPVFNNNTGNTNLIELNNNQNPNLIDLNSNKPTTDYPNLIDILDTNNTPHKNNPYPTFNNK
jgi:hypothetical protein